MPTFRYSAYGASGGESTGTLEADNLRDARLRLKEKGLFPRELVPFEEASGSRKGFSFRRGVSLPELALMTRRLATLNGSAVPLFEAVTTLYDQEQEGPLKKVLARVRDRLAEGSSLAAALAAEPAVFDESYVHMVAAGEAGGALETILERLADFLEDQQAVRSRVSTALAYPVLMAIVGSSVMFFLLAFVIPKITAIFDQNKAALPLITVAVVKTSFFFRTCWWGILLAVIAAFIAYRRLSKREDFRLRRDRFILRLPLAGKLARQLILARFAKVLGLLMSGGVPVIRALQITGDVVVNRVYRDYLSGVRESLTEGGSLSAGLKGSELFPPLLVHMVSVGEKSGELERMLLKAGEAFQKEFESGVTRFMALLEPAMVLAMGVTVGTVVIAVLLPIFQLNQLIH